MLHRIVNTGGAAIQSRLRQKAGIQLRHGKVGGIFAHGIGDTRAIIS